MVNKKETTPKTADKQIHATGLPDKAQLNVRIPEELMRRVNSVSGATGKSLAEWVAGVLDFRTKEYETTVEAIRQREVEIEKNQGKMKP